MQMIGHYNPFIQLNIGEMSRDFQLASFRDGADFLVFKQHHFALGAYGYEIRTFLGIIVILQTDGTTLVHLCAQIHFVLLLLLLAEVVVGRCFSDRASSTKYWNCSRSAPVSTACSCDSLRATG